MIFIIITHAGLAMPLRSLAGTYNELFVLHGSAAIPLLFSGRKLVGNCYKFTQKFSAGQTPVAVVRRLVRQPGRVVGHYNNTLRTWCRGAECTDGDSIGL